MYLSEETFCKILDHSKMKVIYKSTNAVSQWRRYFVGAIPHVSINARFEITVGPIARG